jgi:5'-nucleotidase
MGRIDRRHLLPGAAAFAAALLVALLGLDAGADQPGADRSRAPAGPVELQLLGLSDLHGHLEPPHPGIGGVAWLGAWLDRLERSHPGRTIRAHAGDMVGASPLISSQVDHESTIEATRLMRFDVGTLGNHEFDRGGAEAMRLVRLAGYPYVSASVLSAEAGEPVLPPYVIVERGGVEVGFIGVATEDSPYFLLDEAKRAYRWLDPSEAVNRWVPELRRRGVETIVVLAHAGAFQHGAGAVGEIVDEAAEMDDAVDVVVAGHTHSRLGLEVDGKLVVGAIAYGTAVGRVRITVDRTSGDVVAKSAEVIRTRHEGVAPEPELARLVARYAQGVAPVADRLVGHAASYLDNEAVDRLAVDAQRAFAGTDVAFLNPGNTRSDLEPGPISYADAAEVQPYEHPVWRMRMRGAELLSVLAEQPKLLVSGTRQLDPDAVYTVAANGIVAERPPFDEGTDRESVGTDLEALVAWVGRSRRPGAVR